MNDALLVLCRLPLLDLLEMGALFALGMLALAYGWVALWLTVCAIEAWINRRNR